MACNIYEDPDRGTKKARYSKGVRRNSQETVEKVVDIYDSAEPVPPTPLNPSRMVKGARTQKTSTVESYSYKILATILGLLCLLLLAGINVLLVLYLSKQPPLNGQNQTEEKQNNTGLELRLSRFYYMSTERKTWTESRRDCQRSGGDLAIINSKDKQEIVRRIKIHGDSWIGLQMIQSPSSWRHEWKWVDGSELSYSAWKEGEKTNQEAESKAYTNPEGLWMHNRTGLKYWICERTTTQYLKWTSNQPSQLSDIKPLNHSMIRDV